MKQVLLICFLAMSYLSYSQGQPTALPTLYNGKYYKYTQYLAVDSGLFSPRRDTNFNPRQMGCIVVRTADSIVYVYNGRRWLGIGVGGGAGVYNAGYGLTLVGGVFKVDTAQIGTVAYNLYLYNLLDANKKNKSDSAVNSQSYLTRGKGQNLIDSLAGLTQKNLSAGYGWTLTSNVGAVDTLNIATRARVQKAIDSINIVLGNSIVGNQTTMNSYILTEPSLNSDSNGIRQQVALDDYWKIYGYATQNDFGELVFEVGDNADPFPSYGQRFRFFYNNQTSGTSKSPFIIDYDSVFVNANLIANKIALRDTGSAVTSGKVTLASGIATVNTTAVNSNSVIILTVQETGTSNGRIKVSARVSGTSFSIVSSDLGDNCDVGFIIIN
jgi:hypothetical protein